MYLLLLILFSFVWFFSINLFFVFGSFFLLMVFIISLLVVIYFLYKIYKLRNTKILSFYLFFTLLFSVYCFFYSYIDIKENKNIFLINSNNNFIENTYNYDICLNNECITEENFNKDVEYVNSKINTINNIQWISKLNSDILKLLEKKAKLWIKWVKIEYNYDYILKIFFQKLYNDSISNINFKDNLFFSKNQYEKYLTNFYIFSYENILNDNLPYIKDSEYYRTDVSIYNYLLNRKYVYNRFFINNSVMYSYWLLLSDLNKNINRIKD